MWCAIHIPSLQWTSPEPEEYTPGSVLEYELFQSENRAEVSEWIYHKPHVPIYIVTSEKYDAISEMTLDNINRIGNQLELDRVTEYYPGSMFYASHYKDKVEDFRMMTEVVRKWKG